jgi:hypothetical protein
MNKLRPKTARGHDHVEAFCHMTYRCPAGHEFRIWNSLDGVTPFTARCRFIACDELMQHEDWENDLYDPGYVVPPGDLYWRDGTLGDAIAMYRRILPAWPKDQLAEYMAKIDIADMDAFIDYLATAYHRENPGWPHLDRA